MMASTTVLALDGVFDTGLAAIQDTLATARDLAPPGSNDAWKTQVFSIRRVAHTAHGLAIPTMQAEAHSNPEFVFVPALGAKTEEGIEKALAHPDVRRAGELLGRWQSQGATIAAACTGTFVLAEAGLLNGQEATTSWWLAPFFRSRYPGVTLDDSRSLIPGNAVVTAGAVLAHFDLALWFVRQRSPELADTVARYLMLDPRSPQSTYAISDHLRHTDRLVMLFEKWARQNLDAGFSLGRAATFVGTSERTLSRRLYAILGRSPLAYFQDLRVERATYLLKTTQLSIDEIATRTGYDNGATLRTLLRRKTGRTALEIRRSNQFGT
ncbi:MAG: helix-turn-helix domain-containing protein [Xanthomonadaceae bacterium]|nr:helix-turn-helix domain-containing protein [Xanthomonadaceae bacterium]